MVIWNTEWPLNTVYIVYSVCMFLYVFKYWPDDDLKIRSNHAVKTEMLNNQTLFTLTINVIYTHNRMLYPVAQLVRGMWLLQVEEYKGQQNKLQDKHLK